MSEPLVDATTPSNATASFLLHGDQPRLGGTVPSPAAATEPSTPPTPPPAPTFAAPPATAPAVAPSHAPRPSGPSPMLSAPGSAPVLGGPELPSLPTVPIVVHQDASAHAPAATVTDVTSAVPDLPTLPTVAPAVHQAGPAVNEAEAPVPTDEHPMAHLMPTKSASSEASRRAAGIRAAKKGKARKIKIGVALGALAVTAIVGPPLGKWFVDAINDAGNTSTEVEG